MIMRIVLTGGGTGGHIYPALAIGRQVTARNPDSELLYIGISKGLESRIVPAQGHPVRSDRDHAVSGASCRWTT